MTVCYFTASGNCLYVARRIGGTLLSIPQLMKHNSIEIEDEAVGIVCPVYKAILSMMTAYAAVFVQRFVLQTISPLLTK